MRLDVQNNSNRPIYLKVEKRYRFAAQDKGSIDTDKDAHDVIVIQIENEGY